MVKFTSDGINFEFVELPELEHLELKVGSEKVDLFWEGKGEVDVRYMSGGHIQHSIMYVGQVQALMPDPGRVGVFGSREWAEEADLEDIAIWV